MKLLLKFTLGLGGILVRSHDLHTAVLLFHHSLFYHKLGTKGKVKVFRQMVCEIK